MATPTSPSAAPTDFTYWASKLGKVAIADHDELHDLMTEIVDTPAKARARDRGIEKHEDACVCCGRNLTGKAVVEVHGERIGPTCARKIARLAAR